jgi:hypothetical protein
MRYAFHGKMRATGQVMDGYVEAASSEEAFDRLADQGIIGVHTVRGIPEIASEPKALTVAPAAAPGQAEAILTQLVEKMNVLIGHVETLLTRPGSIAGGNGRAETTGKKRHALHQAEDPTQNETLRAIFQTNLELRRSIQQFNQLTSNAKPGHGSEAIGARAGSEMSLRQAAARPRELARSQPAA